MQHNFQEPRQIFENTWAKLWPPLATTTILKLHGQEKDLKTSCICCSNILSFWGNSQHFTNTTLGLTYLGHFKWAFRRSASDLDEGLCWRGLGSSALSTTLGSVCRKRSQGSWNPAASVKDRSNPLEHKWELINLKARIQGTTIVFCLSTLNILHASVHIHTPIAIYLYVLLIHNANIVP